MAFKSRRRICPVFTIQLLAFNVETSNVFLQPRMYRIKVCVYQYILYHSNHQFQLESSLNLANLKDGEIGSIDGHSHLSINMHCKSAFNSK